MNEGGTTFVHHLGLLLRIEILCDQADDADQLPLPILKLWGALLDQVEKVFLGKAELPLDFLEPGLLRIGIFPAPVEAGNGAPQIVVGGLLMGPPLLAAAPLFGKARLRAVGIAVDAVIAQGMGGVEHLLDRLDPVTLLAFCNVIARKAQIVEDPVGIGPLPEQIIVLEEMVMPKGGVGDDQR